MKKVAIVAAIIIIVISAIITVSVISISQGEVHNHANFLVYLNGEQLNFSRPQYMEEESFCEITAKTSLTDEEKTHMHDNIGWVAHVHAAGVTWGLFFNNIGIKFNDICFVIEGSSYCNNATSELRMFVNGAQNGQYSRMPINDLDRVLITYGTINENVSQQLNNIPDDACIYSGRCPERGNPPTENCGS